MSHEKFSNRPNTDVKEMQTAAKDEDAWVQAKKWHADTVGGIQAAELYDQPDMKQVLHREYLEEKSMQNRSVGDGQGTHQKVQGQADQGFLIIAPIFRQTH